MERLERSRGLASIERQVQSDTQRQVGPLALLTESGSIRPLLKLVCPAWDSLVRKFGLGIPAGATPSKPEDLKRRLIRRNRVVQPPSSYRDLTA